MCQRVSAIRAVLGTSHCGPTYNGGGPVDVSHNAFDHFCVIFFIFSKMCQRVSALGLYWVRRAVVRPTMGEALWMLATTRLIIFGSMWH